MYNLYSILKTPEHDVLLVRRLDLASDCFTVPAHPVPCKPGRPGTTISGVCADTGKYPQNDLFCMHSCSHHSLRTGNQTDAQPKRTHTMIQDEMVWLTNQVASVSPFSH
jgi:hypothetical protein